MIISQALKLQGDFNRTVKISNYSFSDEKVNRAYKKKRYSLLFSNKNAFWQIVAK